MTTALYLTNVIERELKRNMDEGVFKIVRPSTTETFLALRILERIKKLPDIKIVKTQLVSREEVSCLKEILSQKSKGKK